MRAFLIATIFTVAVPVAASTRSSNPGPRIGTPAGAAIARHTFVIRPDGHAVLTLLVASRSVEAREVAFPIDVPHGLVVTRLAIAIAGETAIGALRPATGARDSYDSIVAAMRDPAIVEWTATVAGDDRVTVRVYPIARGVPALVTIELAPAAEELFHVARGTSLVALPTAFRTADIDDPYADYWPDHH